jgi:hypothetical protein
MSWIIGTAILWILKFITVPFAKMLAGDQVKKVAPVTPVTPGPSSEAALTPDQGAAPAPMPVAASVQAEEVIPTGYYILADVIVLGVAGGLMGLISGYYFIGFSFKPKDWPGMIVFIVSSLIGSFIHG